MSLAMQRRHAVGALAGCGVGWLTRSGWAADTGHGHWPAWSAFRQQFVSTDGRVIDSNSPVRHTVSEGQAYALFFALVANDREGFERLLRWTENNLCDGDLSARLPAWQWGWREDGSWGVIDANSASDADLWLTYVLAEAARLWDLPRYATLSRQIGERLLQEEAAELPGLGLTLLPGRQGFAIAPGRWRLNASYSPPQLLHRLAELARQTLQVGDPAPPWERLAHSALQVTLASAPRGFAADWVVYDSQRGFMADSQGPEKTLGGYNAIRIYLWVGTLHAQAAQRTRLLQALRPMAEQVRSTSQVPESVDSLSGQAGPPGPAGFAAALLPFVQAQGDAATLQLLQQRLQQQPPRDDAYFDQALCLFAQGWMDGFYRFGADGRLLPRWSRA